MMNESLGRVGALFRRNLKEILRDPLSLIFMLGMPLGMELLFYAIFHGASAQFEMRYLAPGIVVFSQSFLTLFSGLLISLDRSNSFLTRLYVSKAKASEFILGYAFALLPFVLVQSLLFFLVGGAIDPSLFSLGMLWGILLSIPTSFFFIGMGLLLGSVCGERSIGGVASVLIAGQSMLSGMWFPPDKLSEGFLTAMRVLPFKSATDLVQNAILGFADPTADLLRPLLVTLGYALVAIVAAVLFFRKKMREQ